MGTRSITHIKEDGKTLVTIYRQYDGYLEGMGLDLSKFLVQFTVVNGIPLGDDRKLANGMGCLAAQIIAELKQEVGNVYIYPPNSKDCWEEYKYIVYKKDNEICISCTEVHDEKYGGKKKIFDGSVKDFIAQYEGKTA